MIQKKAFDILKAGKNVYLTGSAGSGKTHVLNAYISYLKDHGVGVGITASTGIAATHIGGVTIHSWSGVGIRGNLSDAEIDALEQKEYLWKRLNKARVLIIDEVSMLSSDLFDSVDRVCRKMKRNDDPFGGMQVVLSGDFFQLPPITRDGREPNFINNSDAWGAMDVRVCYLEEQFRQKDNVLKSILNEIRSGEVSLQSEEMLMSTLNREWGKDIAPTRLYTHNADVDRENEKELDKLRGDEVSYQMRAKGKSNLVESLKKSILAPEVLKLKKNAVVMFVKNNLDAGYVNGTLGIVESFDGGIPVVRTFSGEKICVHEAEWAIEEDGKVLASASQLPLRLAWAITIHKSQGMSMDAALIDLSKSFVPGQGYVALSRLRGLSGLLLKGINNMALAIHSRVASLDRDLLLESEKWDKVVERFSEDDLRGMHEEFILRSGGTLDEKEIKKNRNKKSKDVKDKVSTYEKTRELINKGYSLDDIAGKRGLGVGTIITHLEKLKTLDLKIDLKKFKPKSSDLEKIKEAFGDEGKKLTPAYKNLKGEYSYDDLRLARLFL